MIIYLFSNLGRQTSKSFVGWTARKIVFAPQVYPNLFSDKAVKACFYSSLEATLLESVNFQGLFINSVFHSSLSAQDVSFLS